MTNAITQSEVEEFRNRTPGCAGRIHLNNAGASLMTETVVATQIGYLELEAQIGGYEAAEARADDIEAVYGSCAGLVGAERHQIALVENATVAWLQAFHSVRLTLELGDGHTIITSEADYGANFIAFLHARDHFGTETVVAPSDDSGAVDVDALAGLIDDRTALIAITHAPTNGGLVNPAPEIGAVAADAGVPYLLDACQTVGQMAIDVEAIGCDFLSATGRKYIRGPRGTGFLFVSDAMLDRMQPAMLDHHGASWTAVDSYRIRPDARRYENWEFNYAAVLGLGRAADEALAVGLDRIEHRVVELARSLRDRLTAAGFPVYDLGRRRCGLVTTAIDGRPADEVKAELARRGINISVSAPESTLVDSTRRKLPPLLRLSVHYYNTDAELDRVVATLTEVAATR